MLRSRQRALVKLGFEPYRAKVSADLFRRHNESSVQALFQHFGDEERLRSAVKEARSELEESIQRDLGLAEQLHAKGW